VRTVAPTDSTARIEGEPGTGKAIIARAITSTAHAEIALSKKLNCAAISPRMLEKSSRPTKEEVHGAVGRKVAVSNS